MSDRPDPQQLRQAIVSGDPVQAMPALTELRFLEDDVAVPLLVLGTEQSHFWCDRSVAVVWATNAMNRAGGC